jgi:hypothetical protein
MVNTFSTWLMALFGHSVSQAPQPLQVWNNFVSHDVLLLD